MTSHNSANPGDFGKTVLMPGDPLRAKFIAETFLENAVLVNNIRGVQGYTGYYKGVKVSVMASGMGMPSMGIYSYELFNFYDVDNIIRVGTTGGMQENVKVRDVVFAMGACTDSNYAAQYKLAGTYAPICSWELLTAAVKAAEEKNVPYHVGNVVSSDVFYGPAEDNDKWTEMGVLAVEMEAAALYMNAAKAKKRALTVLTVSNHLLTGEETTAEERQHTFTQMMEIALETAAAFG
ncbi:MAG: purine-nucleoside phosphorylase [Ruminococcaceae bacterium]|nr:purine-nucleoside phosphorylase [Oscillospiraceae bacterium]